jgi:hypothetical protein
MRMKSRSDTLFVKPILCQKQTLCKMPMVYAVHEQLGHFDCDIDFFIFSPILQVILYNHLLLFRITRLFTSVAEAERYRLTLNERHYVIV